MLKRVCAVVVWLSIALQTSAHPNEKHRYRLHLAKEVSTRSKARLQSSLDIAGENLKKSTLDFIGTAAEVAHLTAKGFKVETLEDEPKPLDERYMTPEKISALIFQLKGQYPDLVQIQQIGESFQKRPIWAVRISEKTNVELKPTILINGMHHAREIMTTEITTDVMTYLLSNYDNPQTPEVKAWLDGLAIWIIPQLNPDGNHIVWTLDKYWRKNARGDAQKTWGVDINRNYPFEWNACEGSSGDKNSSTYRGEAASSEPETRAIMALTRQENFSLNISYHSFSELVVAPYGCRPELTPEDFILHDIGASIAKEIKTDDGESTYGYGVGWQSMYSTDGEDISWMYNELNTMAYVIEVNSDAQGFQPDYDQWRNSTILRNRAGWQKMLQRMLKGAQVRGRMLNAQTGQPIEGNVQIVGIKYTNETPRHSKNGVYFKLLAPGSYSLLFSAPGYRSQTISVSLDQSAIQQDIYFEPETLVK